MSPDTVPRSEPLPQAGVADRDAGRTMRPLSICMVSDDFVPGLTGVGVHVQTVAQALVALGHRVTVITARHPGQDALETWNGARVHRVPSLPLFGYRQALATRGFLRRVLVEDAVQVVHYQYLGLLLLQAYHAAASLPGRLRHVYTYHMPVDLLSEPMPLRPLRGFFRRLHVRYCNRFDRIIAPSAGLLDEMKRFGIRTRTDVIRNPVATDAMEARACADRPRSEKPSDRFIVLYVGRLAPEKNLPLLLDAFGQLRRQVPEAELWLVGDGVSRGSLQARATELGLGRSAQFMGFVEHSALGEIYAAADVLVLPSRLEVQGLVAVEAMRFGKPVVVSSQIAAAAELVTEGENGYIVPPDDPAILAMRLRALAASPPLRAAMGKAGLQRSASYRVGDVVGKLAQVYADLVDRGEP